MTGVSITPNRELRGLPTPETDIWGDSVICLDCGYVGPKPTSTFGSCCPVRSPASIYSEEARSHLIQMVAEADDEALKVRYTPSERVAERAWKLWAGEHGVSVEQFIRLLPDDTGPSPDWKKYVLLAESLEASRK